MDLDLLELDFDSADITLPLVPTDDIEDNEDTLLDDLIAELQGVDITSEDL